MKELQEIIQQYRQHRGVKLCLATVAQTIGSTYRRPGARMLILANGQTIGSISGGCLEADVITRAQTVLTTQKSSLLTYDTTSEEDIHFGVGLGCKGVVEVLIEPLDPGNQYAGGLTFVDEVFRKRQKGVIATVIRGEGPVDFQVGDRLMLSQDGQLQGTLGEGTLKKAILSDMSKILQKGRSETRHYGIPGGGAEVFIEVIQAPVRLVLFGAGYDALPLARLARELGFHIIVVDHRPAYAIEERFPQAASVMAARPETLEKQLALDAQTTAVIMSHNYIADRAWLKLLLPKGLRYLGLMGPRRRAEKMLQELTGEGLALPDGSLNTLHNPVGLDIGADSPEQIALAILGEIQAVLAGHAGGHLREKNAAIHTPRTADFQAARPGLNREGALCGALAS